MSGESKTPTSPSFSCNRHTHTQHLKLFPIDKAKVLGGRIDLDEITHIKDGEIEEERNGMKMVI